MTGTGVLLQRTGGPSDGAPAGGPAAVLTRRPPVGGPPRALVVAVCCVAAATVVSSVTALNVTASTLVPELGLSSSQLQWIIAAYGVALAGLLLPAGSLADRFGVRRTLVGGLLTFAAGSFAAIFAGSSLALTGCRAIAGAGAAFVIPTTLVLTVGAFGPAGRGKAIGIWSAAAGVGAAAGVLVAGGLLEFASWRSIFAFSAVLAALAAAGALVVLPHDRPPVRRVRLDVSGAACSLTCLAATIGALIEGTGSGWTSTNARLLVCVAAFAALLFAIVERTTPHPLVDPAIVGTAGFALGAVAITTQFLAMYGMQYLTLQYFQLVEGRSALEAGVRNLPFPLMLMLLSPRSGRIVARFGIARTASAGIALLILGSAILSTVGEGSGYPPVAAGLGLYGAGIALAAAPATAAMMTGVPRAKAGVTAALVDVGREVGGTLGIAVLGGIAAASYRAGLEEPLQGLPPAAQDAAGRSLGAAVGMAERIGPQGDWIALNARRAFMDGYGAAFRASTVLLIGALVAVTLVARRLQPAADA